MADRTSSLECEDLLRLALAAYLIGRDDEFLRLERAHHAFLDAGADLRAARCAFWLGFRLVAQGDMARAAGWLGRAARLVERAEEECVESGYLLLPVAYQYLAQGDYEASSRTAANAVEVGERFRDPDLVALALHVQGRTLLSQTRVDAGLALLDEAMVGVAAGEVSPLVSGVIYCGVIGACRKVYALRRAQEWTEALAEWCAQQPDLVLFNGECLVYRAEIMQLNGAWPAAMGEAQRARERFGGGDPRIPAAAYYQEGEVHRLLGELVAAEDAYRNASRLGREPQPGLALLRLAQGKTDAAAAAIRRVLSETDDPLQRARLLPTQIEILLAAGDLSEARRACADLEETASTYQASVLVAQVAQAQGSIALADGDAASALIPLRHACLAWQALGAPYEAARVRVLLGLACRDLGDDDSATLDFEAARSEFERLHAAPDIARLEALRKGKSTRRAHGLTPRELEVLGLVATGKTNRGIAANLRISEKTVARHISNIFSKLHLSSRSAATAYAYEHDLVKP